MKRALFIFTLAITFIVGAGDSFIYSADGTTAGSKPRDLPSQGYDPVRGVVVVGLHSRTDAERAACGWYRVIHTPQPEAHSNEVWRVGGYAISPSGTATEQWVCSWRKVKPVKYSRLSIYLKLKETGKWDAAEAWLKERDLLTAFYLAQEISSDHPLFVTAKAEAASVLGITPEQVDALLEECKL